jgi:cell wall-associated NlpC family hydrolase
MVLVVLVAVLVLTLGGSHGSPPSARRTVALAGVHGTAIPIRPATVTAHGGAARAPAAGSAAPVPAHPAAGEAAAVNEVRDPEESKSFPAPATVRHAAAIKPSVAAEEVAPGAPSNAEVQAELRQMHAVERAARKQETATLATVPGGDSIGGDGQLPIPQGIPEVVQRVIAGANAITDFPYVFGGGHASFVDDAYDCSGSVSYALAAGGLLSAPETSGTLESWGAPGPGKWITVYANAGHTYMYVNIGGRWMRFDTVGRSGIYASRWQPEIRSNAGFVARHWPGL